MFCGDNCFLYIVCYQDCHAQCSHNGDRRLHNRRLRMQRIASTDALITYAVYLCRLSKIALHFPNLAVFTDRCRLSQNALFYGINNTLGLYLGIG